MFKILAFLTAFSLSQSAFASGCPAIPDYVAEKDRLHSELLGTRSDMDSRVISDQLWIIWTIAPDEMSQQMLDRGRERIRVADYEQAEEAFDDLVEYCPHYAEGWNQRAFVHYLRQNYDASLDDIAVVLDLEPRHFGALAGRATVLISIGRTEIGHIALRAALKINPWLSERHLLPPGEDIWSVFGNQIVVSFRDAFCEATGKLSLPVARLGAISTRDRPLPAHYDEFVFRAKLHSALDPEQTLYFATIQECADGQNAWVEIPVDGQNSHDLKKPAPGLYLTNPSGHSH